MCIILGQFAILNSMTKPRDTLSRSMKFIIGYLYVHLFSNALLILVVLIDRSVLLNPSLADTIFAIAASIVTGGATAYALYSLHARKKTSRLVVVVTIFLSYAVNSFPFGLYAGESSVLESFVWASIFVTLDLFVIIYMLMSKEVALKFAK